MWRYPQSLWLIPQRTAKVKPSRRSFKRIQSSRESYTRGKSTIWKPIVARFFPWPSVASRMKKWVRANGLPISKTSSKLSNGKYMRTQRRPTSRSQMQRRRNLSTAAVMAVKSAVARSMVRICREAWTTRMGRMEWRKLMGVMRASLMRKDRRCR